MTTLTSRSLPLIPLPLKISLLTNNQDMLMISPNEKSSSDRMSPQNRMDHHEDGSSFGRNSTMDESEARSSPVSSIQTDNNFPVKNDDEDDRTSCCSDDSELSVGKEVIARTEQFNRRSSLDTLEELSNESTRFTMQRKNSTDELLRFPLVRPSTARFQEEFLRNSQLYAEELMKQQMSIVAAARGISLSPKDNPINGFRNLTENDVVTKIGFRPHIRTTNEQQISPTFRGIHSHLNAISQITNNLNHNIQKITSPSLSSMTSRESSQSPPNNNNNNHHQQQLHHHHHQFLNHQIAMNNNLNDANLKFSIDNILKADFGRRITDPLKRSKTKKNAVAAAAAAAAALEKNCTEKTAPIDLTASQQQEKSALPSSNSSSNSSNSSSKSSDPMVWPAWVYCTRYSDRPSSGI